MKRRIARLNPNQIRAKGQRLAGQVGAASTSFAESSPSAAALGIDSNNIYLLYLRSTKASLQIKGVAPHPSEENERSIYSQEATDHILCFRIRWSVASYWTVAMHR